jgi:FkbM family methyltransferase
MRRAGARLQENDGTPSSIKWGPTGPRCRQLSGARRSKASRVRAQMDRLKRSRAYVWAHDLAHEMLLIRSRASADSVFRWCCDAFLAGMITVVPPAKRDRYRTIRLKDGATVTYRLNAGDLQSMRECLLQDHYRVAAQKPSAVVDLGANIGLAAIVLARQLGTHEVVCVEPAPANAALVRRNLEQNGITAARVIEAAVGEFDGEAMFAESGASNLGRVSETGVPIRVLAGQTVLDTLPREVRVGVAKIDIEGAEAQLLAGDLAWLDRVDRVLMEIHTDLGVEPEQIVRRLAVAGFRLDGEERYQIWSFSRAEDEMAADGSTRPVVPSGRSARP